jgi:hypothetical protein
MFFKLSSLMVAAVLGSFGVIYSDMSLIISASLISPLMPIVGDIAKNLVKMNIENIFTNFATLLIMVIIAFLIGLRIQKIKNGSAEKIPFLVHIFIGFVLGLFITYVSRLPKTSETLMQQIGVSIAIIFLIPIIKIGLLLGQFDSETLYADIIKNIKIIAANLIPFFIGATLVDMLVL